MKKSWFTIKNLSEQECEVSLYDEIGAWGISAKDFLNELKAVGDRKIILRINSPGGEVFDGLAIFNRLSEHAPGVEVCIDGIAASMASVIAMVGSPIKMASNALMMIHDPNGICMGDSSDMRDLADVLDKIKGCLIGAYTKKTGKTEDEISTMMKDETFLDANEAKEMGFIDEITGAMKIAAKFDKLSLSGKLAEREKLIDAAPEGDNTTANESVQSNTTHPNTMADKTPAEIELEKIETKRISDARALEIASAKEAAVADERKRVTDIRAWAGDVETVQKIDLKEVTDKFIGEGKSLGEFKEHVIKNTFKAKTIVTATDTTGAQGNTMSRSAFNKLTPLDQRDFCLKGGKITEPRLVLHAVED